MINSTRRFTNRTTPVKIKKNNSWIHFFNNHPSAPFPVIKYQKFAERVAAAQNINLTELNIITVDDNYLAKFHKLYLSDPSYTDVLTFLLDDPDGAVGEIYLSIDRAKHNAKIYKVSPEEEYARLIVHGILHLKGMDDKTEADREKMHQIENIYLEKFWESENKVKK